MDILYKIIRTFNLLLAIIPTIGIYRATVQPEYNWGLLALYGTGRSSDYKWLLLFTMIAWASFVLERWYKRKWYYLFPGLLFTTSFLTVSYGFLNEMHMKFQGDAWNVSFDIKLFLTLLFTVLFLCSILWIFHELRNFKPLTLKPGKRTIPVVVVIVVQTFIILFLFDQGEGGIHTNFDRIAVALTVIQGFTIAYLTDNSGIKERNTFI